MSIRAATINDLDAIIDLGKHMHAESSRFGALVFDELKVRKLITGLLSRETGFVLVAEEPDGNIFGGFAGFISEHWYSTDQVAQDLGLFVRMDRRGGIAAARMVKAFIYWAQDRGAKQITLGISTGIKVEQTAQLYRSLGLKQFGYCFEV